MKSPFEIDEYSDDLDPWEYESNQSDVVRKNWFKTFTMNLKSQRTLDIGCGTGFISELINTDEYVGIDISPTSTNYLNNRFSKKGISNTHKAILGSVLSLDSLNLGKFDLIVATGVFYEHYLGHNLKHIESQIDLVSEKDTVLVTVHISNWTNLIPYHGFIELDRWKYPYRDFEHELIIQKRII